MEINHRCRAGDTCVAKTPDGAAVTPKPDALCHNCIKQIQEQLRQLPDVRDVLRGFFLATPIVAAGDGPKVESTPDPPTPINLRALDLIDEIDVVLENADGPQTRVDDLIRKYPDGVDRALAIGRVWRKADAIIGTSLKWEQRAAKCPKCDKYTLGCYAGSETVHCTNCGHAMTREGYVNLLRQGQ